MKFLLDTNVFREPGKDVPHVNVAAWLAARDDAELAISTITVREMRKGIMKLRSTRREVADQMEVRALRL
jgi:predicted nucleic acid-binding protein